MFPETQPDALVIASRVHSLPFTLQEFAMRLSEEIEIDGPPIYELGDRVRVRKLIRNDGTFPGKDIGYHLAKKGDVGYIAGIGTYLQRAYIYSVHFLDTNFVVGCLSKELELAEEP